MLGFGDFSFSWLFQAKLIWPTQKPTPKSFEQSLSVYSSLFFFFHCVDNNFFILLFLSDSHKSNMSHGNPLLSRAFAGSNEDFEFETAEEFHSEIQGIPPNEVKMLWWVFQGVDLSQESKELWDQYDVQVLARVILHSSL
jgi:hypothetical protein